MTGRLTDTDALNAILWRDSTLESVTVDYDTIGILIQESSSRIWRLVCRGYIGYRGIGFWDEFVIRAATILYEDPFLQSCATALEQKKQLLAINSGSPDRNNRRWQLLRIQLDDGASVDVVANSFDAAIATAVTSARDDRGSSD